MSRFVVDDCLMKARFWPSGDHDPGCPTTGTLPRPSRGSASPPLGDNDTMPLDVANVTRFPSGVQVGQKFKPSGVKLVMVSRMKS